MNWRMIFNMSGFLKYVLVFGLVSVAGIFLFSQFPAPADEIDLRDANAVFRRVFETLPASVTVYPTENYYYFELPVAGKIIHGNLRLDARDRDNGLIYFGYFERQNSKPITLGSRVFGSEDGVEVKKIDAWNYDVSAFGKTVRFTLNDVGFAPPPSANMAAGEVYVGPVFDESGVRFHLMFQENPPHFFYALNESGPPDSQNGFVFYDDAPRGRKILIGVKDENIRMNNYYDGPFDQLPDNYVGQTNIRKYIELAYPDLKGQIDEYGGFINQPGLPADPVAGSRLAISPYYLYSDPSEFEFVDKCKNNFKLWPELLTCITPDFYQLNSLAK